MHTPEPISTEDVRGAVVLSMEGFWHPDAGADFDAWHEWTRAEAQAQYAWSQFAECDGELRTHGPLCQCFAPLERSREEIKADYIESFINRSCGSSEMGDE